MNLGPCLRIEFIKYIEPQTGIYIWRAHLPEVGVIIVDTSIIGCINNLAKAIPALESEVVLHGRN